MISLHGRRILLYGKPVDMRKGFVGLQELVLRQLNLDPLSGNAFVFISRSGRLVKCLLWDRTGFVIVCKRLENSRFRLRTSASLVELEKRGLEFFMDGVEVGGSPVA